MADLGVLSGLEFEELCRDLLAAEFGRPVSSFAAGPDGGIDLRWTTTSGSQAIGQCKHYAKSGFEGLMRSLRTQELDKVRLLAPDEYWVVTSVELTPERKDKIHRLFREWMSGPDSVIGADDLDGLLRRQPQVLRHHLKLLLGDSARLAMFLHGDAYNRTADRIERINESLPIYVVTEAHQRARELLAEHRVCLVSGEPGAGKSTLAQMLVAEAIHEGYELIDLGGGIVDAWRMLRPRAKQVFFYDDFLGELRLDWLGRDINDVVRFIERVARSSSTLLVMTTREYILRDAERVREKLGRLDPNYRFLLDIGLIMPDRAARMVFNHLWHADLPSASREALAATDFSPVIYHPAFNPRVIETCTTRAWVGDGTAYADRLRAALDHPDELWQTAFAEYLDGHARLVLYSLAVQPPNHGWDELAKGVHKTAELYRSLAEATGILPGEARYQHAIAILEDSFIRARRDRDRALQWIEMRNPSITAFVLDRLCHDIGALHAVLALADDVRTLDALVASLERTDPTVRDDVRAAFREAVVRLSQDPKNLEDLLIFSRTSATAWLPGRKWLEEAVDAYVRLLTRRRDCAATVPQGRRLLMAFAGDPLQTRLHAAIDQHIGPFDNSNYGEDDWDELVSHLADCAELEEACPLGRGAIEDAFDHFAHGLLSAVGQESTAPPALTAAADLDFLTSCDGSPSELIDELRIALGFSAQNPDQLPLFDIPQSWLDQRSKVFEDGEDNEIDKDRNSKQVAIMKALFRRLSDSHADDPAERSAPEPIKVLTPLPNLA